MSVQKNGSIPITDQEDDKHQHWLIRWLAHKPVIGHKHILLLFSEKGGSRSDVMKSLRQTVRDHYVDPNVVAKWIAELGAPQTAALLKEHMPTSKRARSADVGEILAVEITEQYLDYSVPIRRLRWKDSREMALHGDDVVAFRKDENGLTFLKGEAKSRASLTPAVVRQASEALGQDDGRPNRHSVLFVANRLREQGEDKVSRMFYKAVMNSFSGYGVEHLLFSFSGNSPEVILYNHLKELKCEERRYAVGLQINDHGDFIRSIYEGL